MRMWHYKLVSFLPSAQLIGQWRECIAIAHDWATHELKHPLVMPVTNYSPLELLYYCGLVKREMEARGFKIREYTIVKLKDYIYQIHRSDEVPLNYSDYSETRYRDWMEKVFDGYLDNVLFDKWHNETYLEICYWNMYEKYLCGCVPEDEWCIFVEGGRELI